MRNGRYDREYWAVQLSSEAENELVLIDECFSGSSGWHIFHHVQKGLVR